ncbi:glycosyltransferase [Faecalibaculum rodentium]|uniref:glycosyltransferase n=1 Tax=Faecalibaculum rodentium TaxID=1702221 RepID=UPI00272F1A1C|nr:glycosyltransferase [Faecalibaculum rodentium]
MKAYAVLVVYNKKLTDCPSFCSAVKEPDVQLLVVDNSTDELIHNQEEARKAGAWFLSMNGNKGLSGAYNAALDRLESESGDWVVLLDDDTVIPDEYWKQLRQEVPDAIRLPVVRTYHGEIISPAEMKHDIPRSAKSPDCISNITGINSGMAIPKRLMLTYRYDENLFLDFIDHQFLKDMKQSGESVRILPVELTQDFSADAENIESAMNRFRILRSDLKVFYRQNPWKFRFLITKRKIKLYLQLRNLEVFCG